MQLILAAAMACGLTFPAVAQTPFELQQIANSIRPALVQALAPEITVPISGMVCVGLRACENATGKTNVVIGACSGTSLRDGDDNILVGDHTATPTPHTSGFVNIGNKLCFWRASGVRADCPPPEPDCAEAK